MVFKINMAISLSLLTLVAGMFLLIRAWKEEICCKVFVKIVGYVVVIVSILLFLCSSYHGILYKVSKEGGWGYGRGGMMRGKGMMHRMMRESFPMREMMQPEEGRGE